MECASTKGVGARKLPLSGQRSQASVISTPVEMMGEEKTTFSTKCASELKFPSVLPDNSRYTS